MSISVVSGASSDVLSVDATSKAARVTLYDALGREVSSYGKSTFYMAGSFTPVATPNELVIIYGSASKTVRVLSMRIGAANTAAGSQIFLLIKRSAIFTGGVLVAGTAVPADTAQAVTAATATNFGHFSTDPTPGASAGTINIIKVGTPAVTPATWAGITDYAQWEMIPEILADPAGLRKPITLNGVNQGLAINFNDVALVAGQVHHYNVVWTEE